MQACAGIQLSCFLCTWRRRSRDLAMKVTWRQQTAWIGVRSVLCLFSISLALFATLARVTLWWRNFVASDGNIIRKKSNFDHNVGTVHATLNRKWYSPDLFCIMFMLSLSLVWFLTWPDKCILVIVSSHLDLPIWKLRKTCSMIKYSIGYICIFILLGSSYIEIFIFLQFILMPIWLCR